MPRNNKRLSRSRRGVALIAVLVCMGVAMTILLAVVQKSLSCRRQIQNEARLEQTRWLVDAGVRKAIAELEQRPDYDGEQISIANSVHKFGFAKVEIKTQSIKSSPNQVRVIVSAELGDKDDEVLKTRRTKELVFEVPSSKTH